MGLFDNVNWQQALPGALMGFAGAYDPNSSKELAASGWSAVQNYMKQQALQQEQEQFKERMKLMKEEQGQRERQLKISEDRASRDNEEALEDQYISSRMGEVFGMLEKDPETPASSIWNLLNDENRGSVKLSPDRFMSKFRQSEFFKTKEGPVMMRFNDGKLEMYREVTGGAGGKKIKPVTLVEGMSKEVFDAIKSNPAALKNVAKQFRDKGENAAAEVVEGFIPKPVKDIELAKLKLDATNKEFAAAWKAEEKNFEVEPYTGDYPGNPFPMGTAPKAGAKGYEEYKKNHDDYNAGVEYKKSEMLKSFSERLQAISSSLTQEDIAPFLDPAVAGGQPYTPPKGYEDAYKTFLRVAATRKMSGPPAVAWARAATDKAVQMDEAQERAQRRRKPVSVRREEGEEQKSQKSGKAGPSVSLNVQPALRGSGGEVLLSPEHMTADIARGVSGGLRNFMFAPHAGTPAFRPPLRREVPAELTAYEATMRRMFPGELTREEYERRRMMQR